jgi:hypothetical protein
MAVSRYNLNGTLDSTFGGTGEVTTVESGPAIAHHGQNAGPGPLARNS